MRDQKENLGQGGVLKRYTVTQIPITMFKMKQSGVESEVQCHTCFHGII